MSPAIDSRTTLSRQGLFALQSDVMQYPFPTNVLLPVIRNSWVGAVYVANGICHRINTTLAGANRSYEIGEPITASVDMQPSQALSYAPHQLACYTDWVGGGAPAAGSFMGIQIGTINSNPPFPAAPTGQCIQVRLRADNGEIDLYSSLGDGVTNATIIASGVLPFNYFERKLILRVYPNVKAQVFLGGVLVVENTNPATLPFMNAPLSRSGLIVASGTSATWNPSAIWSQPVFSMDDVG